DLFTRDGLHTPRVDILDALANLFFPFLTQCKAIQARSNGFDQIRALARWQIEGVLQNLSCLRHSVEASISRRLEHPSRDTKRYPQRRNWSMTTEFAVKSVVLGPDGGRIRPATSVS